MTDPKLNPASIPAVLAKRRQTEFSVALAGIGLDVDGTGLARLVHRQERKLAH